MFSIVKPPPVHTYVFTIREDPEKLEREGLFHLQLSKRHKEENDQSNHKNPEQRESRSGPGTTGRNMD